MGKTENTDNVMEHYLKLYISQCSEKYHTKHKLSCDVCAGFVGTRKKNHLIGMQT
jgi:hypothetical protein